MGMLKKYPSRIYEMNIFLIFLIYKAETSGPHQINSNTNISQVHKAHAIIQIIRVILRIYASVKPRFRGLETVLTAYSVSYSVIKLPG